MKVRQTQPTPVKQTVCHFKYNPEQKKLVIECQPIRPYCIIDQLNVDKFEKAKPNPNFKGEEIKK